MDGMPNVKRQRPGAREALIPETLARFPGIHVWVSHLDADLIAEGLDREYLWLQVQEKLLRAGLPVPSQHSWQQTPLFPCLGVLVHADRAQVTPSFYVFSVEIFYVQKISLAGIPTANAMRMTWCREAIGDVPEEPHGGFDWSNLYDTVSSLVDQFIQEYLGLAVPKISTYVCN